MCWLLIQSQSALQIRARFLELEPNLAWWYHRCHLWGSCKLRHQCQGPAALYSEHLQVCSDPCFLCVLHQPCIQMPAYRRMIGCDSNGSKLTHVKRVAFIVYSCDKATVHASWHCTSVEEAIDDVGNSLSHSHAKWLPCWHSTRSRVASTGGKAL